jgi:hypothetical protein
MVKIVDGSRYLIGLVVFSKGDYCVPNIAAELAALDPAPPASGPSEFQVA